MTNTLKTILTRLVTLASTDGPSAVAQLSVLLALTPTSCPLDAQQVKLALAHAMRAAQG